MEGTLIIWQRFVRRLAESINRGQSERTRVLFLILIAGVVRLRNLDSPITGSYTFRYTQTAWGIRSVFRGANSPFSVETPVLGAPWRIPFEFPLFQLIAGFVSRIARLDPQITGRLVSLFFFLLTAYVFYKLLRRFISSVVSLLTLTVFLFCAHNLEYGSAVLIEYCALFFALSTFTFVIDYLEKETAKSIGLVFISSVITGLVKITTSVLWVGIGTIALAFLFKASPKKISVLFITVALSQIPAMLWTRWADQQKATSIWTSWLTSSNLSAWNFGTLRQRLFYFDWYRAMVREFFPSVLGAPIFVVSLIILAISLKSPRRPAVVFLLLFLAGPFVFTNLYFVHDYYWTAVLPALLLTLGIGANSLVENERFATLSAVANTRLLIGLVTISLVAASWFSEYGTRHFDVFARPGRIDLNSSNDLVAVEQLEKFTNADDKIVVIGADWNPSILYFADRKGLMIRHELSVGQQAAIGDLQEQYDYVILFSRDEIKSPVWAEMAKHLTLTRVTDILFKITSLQSH